MGMRMKSFWDIVSCSLGVDLCFRGAYCLLLLMIEAVCTSWNVILLQWEHTAMQTYVKVGLLILF